MYNYFMIGLLCLIIYMAVYALIDRICRCFEHCANARYCAEYMNKGEILKAINNKTQEK